MSMRQLLPLCLIGGLFLAGCTTPEQPESGGTPAPVDPAQGTAQNGSDDWSSGDSLLTVMGPLQGKVVADMFAGDGYYTWKLLGAGARVLAIDDNPANIAALEARKKAEGIGDERLLVRLTTPGVTGLIPNEVDLALITREYSQLGDRQAWFAQLMALFQGKSRVCIYWRKPRYRNPASKRPSSSTRKGGRLRSADAFPWAVNSCASPRPRCPGCGSSLGADA